jgi:hypothetical protein
MLNPPEIIKKIKKTCKIYFSESSFKLEERGYNRFVVSGNYTTKAINNYNNSREEVNVIKWFNDFWLYIDIKFVQSEDNIDTFISISVFQGENSDNIKKQLFRAEWDNFDNNDTHPQPHWHIYPDYDFEKTFSEFLGIHDEGNSFADLLNEDKSKIIDLKRIHFAMNGAWSIKNGHIHRINEGDSIINWLHGLLAHIKSQLEYVE